MDGDTAPRQQRVNRRTEAHITLVHGAELLHACSAAVNAEMLKRADPRRVRIAYGWKLSRESREVLSHGWQLQEQPNVVGSLIDTDSGRKAVVLDATLPGKSKPLSRAIFWDADHMPMATSKRLRHLWEVRPDAELLAYPESTGCFNTGFMLFRPSRLRRREYERLLAATSDEARGRFSRGDPRCTVTRRCWRNPCQPNDQSYLNAVYSSKSAVVRKLRDPSGAEDVNAGSNTSLRGRYLPVPPTALRMRTSTKFGMQYRSRACLITMGSLRTVDTFHFYARLAPWRGDCAKCALLGKRCSCAPRPPARTHQGSCVE